MWVVEMKDSFPEFYNKPDFEILWKECTFVIDTNIFIELYSVSKDDYDEFFSVLQQISSRLWMPYQIGWEYQKNRHKGIKDAHEKHNEFKSLTNELNPKKIKKIKNSLKDLTKLQIDHVDEDLVNQSLDDIDSSIENMLSGIELKPDFEDKIRTDLESLYNGKIGCEYPTSKLKEICKEATYRYKIKIPPGFKDENKKTGNPFGDLIIWKQILEYSKDNKKSIIFITEDGKEDWWLNGKPHPHLIKEFALITEQNFYMYKFSDFLTEANNNLKTKIKPETIYKVKEQEKLSNMPNGDLPMPSMLFMDRNEIMQMDKHKYAFNLLFGDRMINLVDDIMEDLVSDYGNRFPKQLLIEELKFTFKFDEEIAEEIIQILKSRSLIYEYPEGLIQIVRNDNQK